MAWGDRKMRILWLDHPSRYNRHDKWLHIEFAKKLAKHVEALYLYGYQFHELCPDLTPIPYSRITKMQEVVDNLKIDTIVMDTRSGMYDNYLPVSIYPDSVQGRCWLPEDFPKVNVLKICIEEDFQYEYDDDWYVNMGVKVILQKHYSQSLRKFKLPVEFFPFSVDTSVFKPEVGIRKKRFCLAGSGIEGVYVYRLKAAQVLEHSGMIDIFKGMQKEGDKYIHCLKDYISHLSCGSRYSLTPAKTFEIMASGSVLFTNKFMGIEKILDEGSYVTYENDGSDVLDKAKMILEKPDFVKQIISRATNCINKRHTHEIRIKEFFDIVEKYR